MTHEELRAWCHGEMHALAGSPMHARGAAFLKLLDASLGVQAQELKAYQTKLVGEMYGMGLREQVRRADGDSE